MTVLNAYHKTGITSGIQVGPNNSKRHQSETRFSKNKIIQAYASTENNGLIQRTFDQRKFGVISPFSLSIDLKLEMAAARTD